MLLADWLSFLNYLPDWMVSYPFIISMAVLLLALIGAYIVIRNKRPEDED